MRTRRWGQGIAGRAREEVHSRILLALALKNDLLRVGEDYVEARTIERVQRRSGLLEPAPILRSE